MTGLFGNTPARRNPLMLPRVNERLHEDVTGMASALMGRPAYNTGDVIAQILSGGLAGLADRRLESQENERSQAFADEINRIFGINPGGASGVNGGSDPMGSLLSQTSANSPETSPSAAPAGPVGRRPIDGMEMPMGQPETDYFAGVAQSESGGQMIPNASGSGAFGTYQFMPATWQGLVEQYPDQLTPDGIRDPAQQEIAMGLYTEQSRGILTEALGREPSNAELYAAHALGPGGAVQFLQALEADPNLPMEQLVQQIAGDNAGVWMEQNPQFAGKSVSDMMAMYSAPFGGSSAPVQTAQAPAPAMTGAPLSAAPTQSQGMSDQQRQILGFLLANGYEDQALGLMAQAAFASPQSNLPAGVQEIQWLLSQPAEVQQYLIDNGLMGRAGTNVTVNNNTGSTGPNMIDVSESVGDVWSEASTAGADASNFLAMLDTMETLFPQADTGAGAQTINELASWARRFGIDVDTSSMGAGQALVTLMNRMALQVRSPDGPFGGMPGATSNRDITFLLDSIPSISQTPEGFQLAVLGMRQIFQRAQELQGLAMQYYDPQTGQVDPGFLTAYNELVQSPIFTDDTRNQINSILGVASPTAPAEPIPDSAYGPGASFDGLVEGQRYVLPDGRIIIYRGDGQADFVD